jgi:hypothetical protein
MRTNSGEEISKEETALNTIGGRSEDNIKFDLKEIECKGVEWIQMGQNRSQRWAFVNAVMHLVP